MIRLTPPDGCRFQFKAILSHLDIQSGRGDHIAWQKENGATDFLHAIGKKMSTRVDEKRYGTIIELDAVALSIEEYEDLLQKTYLAGLMDGRRERV